MFCFACVEFRTTDSTGNAELDLASALQKQRHLWSTRTKSHLHKKPNLRTVDYLCHAGTRHVLTAFTATTTSRNPQTSFFLSICLSSHIHQYKNDEWTLWHRHAHHLTGVMGADSGFIGEMTSLLSGPLRRGVFLTAWIQKGHRDRQRETDRPLQTIYTTSSSVFTPRNLNGYVETFDQPGF